MIDGRWSMDCCWVQFLAVVRFAHGRPRDGWLGQGGGPGEKDVGGMSSVECRVQIARVQECKDARVASVARMLGCKDARAARMLDCKVQGH